MSFSAKMMNLGMRKVYDYLEKDPKTNLPKLMEMIDKVLEEATIRFSVPPNRLTANEKLSVIREMDSRGVFLAKGSVNEVAEKLGSSKATIYRYLHQLEK